MAIFNSYFSLLPHPLLSLPHPSQIAASTRASADRSLSQDSGGASPPYHHARIFFHFSAYSPKILTLYCHEIRSDTRSPLKMATSIIASCNGHLLLRIQPRSKHFVFSSSNAALAVDLDNSPFKLVTAEAEAEIESEQR